MKIRSNYGKWYMTFNSKYKKYELRQIRDFEHEQRICEKQKDIFIGTYENALKYFGMEHLQKLNTEEIIDRFLKSIEFYQLEEKTVTRTSAELFDKLMNLCSYKKYYIPEEYREEIILETLKIANELHLIKDEYIMAKLDENNKRYYKQKKFEKQYYDELAERGLI